MNQTSIPQAVFLTGSVVNTHNQVVQPLPGQLQVVSGVVGQPQLVSGVTGQQQVIPGVPVQPQVVSGVPGQMIVMYPGQPQLVQTASPQYLVTPAAPAVVQMAQPQNPTPDADPAVIQTAPPQYSDAASGEWDTDGCYDATERLCRILTKYQHVYDIPEL